MRVFFLFFLLAGCTTPESDYSNNFSRPVYETRVNTAPLSREERIRFIQVENERYRILVKPVEEFKEKIINERSAFVGKIEKDFPLCKNQKYCQSNVSSKGVNDFERFNELTAKVHKYDYQIVDLENKLKDLEHAHDLRVRHIYNRYLIRQILDLTRNEPRFNKVLVHSLESFPSRLELSKRLHGFIQDLPGVQGSDYDFSLFGKPVDEAAILLTIDVWRAPINGSEPVRFITTLLINAHSLDIQAYEKSFADAWSKTFMEPNFESLKKSVFCHLYGMASASLAQKMPTSKQSQCSSRRQELSTIPTDFDYKLNPSNWILPITFFQAKYQKDF